MDSVERLTSPVSLQISLESGLRHLTSFFLKPPLQEIYDVYFITGLLTLDNCVVWMRPLLMFGPRLHVFLHFQSSVIKACYIFTKPKR
jgi:hypothetical protein